MEVDLEQICSGSDGCSGSGAGCALGGVGRAERLGRHPRGGGGAEPNGSADTAEGEGLRYGSYGRVTAGSNTKGGRDDRVQVVSYAPRLLERSYVELDFAYAQSHEETRFEVVTTLALDDGLFHFDSTFESNLAIRNLFVQVSDPGIRGLSVWAGSRMLRGDDIYLLDFWPLDEQNTLGGGLRFAWGATDSVSAHLGLHQPRDEFAQQTIQAPSDEVGARDVLFLDRQRFVVSVRGEQHLGLDDALTLKAVAYSEIHALPQGARRDANDDPETLPSDSGVLGGLELGVYGYGEGNFANVFLRIGSGLAAFDELTVPGDLAFDRSTEGADELVLGFSTNLQNDAFGVLAGGYARKFEDADGVVFDSDDGWEFAAAIRPAWFITDVFHVLAEANVQYRRPNGVFLETGALETPMVWQFALMPSLSRGRGSLARPQLRLIYALTWLNDSALLTFSPEDPKRNTSTRHFIGLSAEWWFNSTRG